jgi:hypothetical protein
MIFLSKFTQKTPDSMNFVNFAEMSLFSDVAALAEWLSTGPHQAGFGARSGRHRVKSTSTPPPS